MNDRTSIGGNNPPEKEKIIMLPAATEIPVIVQADIKELTQKIDDLLSTSGRVPGAIENQEVYDKVVALIAAMRDAESDRDERRKKQKEPYHQATLIVDKLYKLPNKDKEDRSKLLEVALKDLNKRLSACDTAEYEKRKIASEAEAAKLAEEAAKDGITIAPASVAIKLESRKSEHGGTSTKTIIRDWEVENESVLPRTVLSIDPKKVQALVDQGATIPGIKVTERISTVVKRS